MIFSSKTSVDFFAEPRRPQPQAPAPGLLPGPARGGHLQRQDVLAARIQGGGQPRHQVQDKYFRHISYKSYLTQGEKIHAFCFRDRLSPHFIFTPGEGSVFRSAWGGASLTTRAHVCLELKSNFCKLAPNIFFLNFTLVDFSCRVVHFMTHCLYMLKNFLLWVPNASLVLEEYTSKKFVD